MLVARPVLSLNWIMVAMPTTASPADASRNKKKFGWGRNYVSSVCVLQGCGHPKNVCCFSGMGRTFWTNFYCTVNKHWHNWTIKLNYHRNVSNLHSDSLFHIGSCRTILVDSSWTGSWRAGENNLKWQKLLFISLATHHIVVDQLLAIKHQKAHTWILFEWSLCREML